MKHAPQEIQIFEKINETRPLNSGPEGPLRGASNILMDGNVTEDVCGARFGPMSCPGDFVDVSVAIWAMF